MNRPLNDFERNMVAKIEEHGWFCLHVGAGDGEPNFAYTIGFLDTLGIPDVIIFGLSRELHHAMLWELFRQARAGLQFSDGLRVSRLIDGYDCILRPALPERAVEYMTSTVWYLKHRGIAAAPLPAYQLFWPGKQQGLFPWESGCDPDVRDFQPLLYTPKVSGAG